MIPSAGCDPEINIIMLGALILKQLKKNSLKTHALVNEIPKKLGVSGDHIILTTDWLYTIHAIEIKGDEVFLNEVE